MALSRRNEVHRGEVTSRRHTGSWAKLKPGFLLVLGAGGQDMTFYVKW